MNIYEIQNEISSIKSLLKIISEDTEELFKKDLGALS